MRMFPDAPLGEPVKAFRDTFSAFTVLKDAFFPACARCAQGSTATKLKRQWVHHEPATGRIIVCTAHDLKPGS